ncbi:MAG: VWA domain-containing protein [Verrucomicrobiota bacterium]
MSFQYPIVLFLIAFIAVPVLVWVWRRRGRELVLPFDESGVPHATGWNGTLNLFASLPALILAVALVLAAVPLRLGEPVSKRKLTNIEFCVDISGSMTAEFGEGSRYDVSMAAITEFLDFREGDAFGLTFFGNSVLHWTPLTTDSSPLRCAPPFMRPEMAPSWFGGTEIGKALLACREMLASRETGDRMIILVSDGFSFDLGGNNDAKITAQLKKDNIVVYAIHIADSEVPGPIVNITSATGGEVFEPGDPAALRRVFQRIDEMQQTEIEKSIEEASDNFEPWCYAGLALLGLFAVSRFGLRHTPW